VIEFNKSGRRIILSHSRIFEDEKRAEETSERKSKVTVEKSSKKMRTPMESTTLGDISELAALKDRMEAAEKVQSKKTKKAAPIEEKIVVEDEEPVEDQVVIEEPVVETTAPETEEPVVETPATETEETEAPAAPKTRKKKEPTQENDDSAEKEA
ncbi:MAG: hypothetical protein WC388_09570, partial [Bacteroidales bacterium]